METTFQKVSDPSDPSDRSDVLRICASEPSLIILSLWCKLSDSSDHMEIAPVARVVRVVLVAERISSDGNDSSDHMETIRSLLSFASFVSLKNLPATGTTGTIIWKPGFTVTLSYQGVWVKGSTVLNPINNFVSNVDMRVRLGTMVHSNKIYTIGHFFYSSLHPWRHYDVIIVGKCNIF